MGYECPSRTRCLHLVASAGRSQRQPQSWSGIDGAIRRIPLGVRTCAIYARVSTSDKGQNPENQVQELRRFAATQGWTVAEEFVDLESGASSQRARFNAMLSAASRRTFDVLLFWSLDRFSREGALKTLHTLNLLSCWKVAYRSFTEPYLDSAGVFSDAIIALLATLAKQERVRMRERVSAGLDRARREGRRLGRPPKVFNRGRVLELRELGRSWNEIARELGISPTGARRAWRAAQTPPAENLAEEFQEK
ncbi:MAG: recombinase family protein [Acidobacteria bacterium]|nr:recombinase family protein [Acidobacteriota bacterium]